MNQTIKNSLAREVNSARNNWDEKIPLTLLGIRASCQATTKLAPAEVLLGHKVRLPMVAEALVREETLADNATPEARATQQEALITRQQHMEEIEDVALRNIERAADRMRAYSTRQAEKRKALEGPSGGDLILIKDFSKAGLTPNWEPTAYKCGGYNNNRTQIIVQDAVGKQWYEAIEHVAL